MKRGSRDDGGQFSKGFRKGAGEKRGWGGESRGGDSRGGDNRAGDSRGGFGRRDAEGGGFRSRERSDERPPRRTFRREDAPGATWGARGSGGDRPASRRPWTPPEDRGTATQSFAPRAPQPVGIRKLKEGIATANRALAELLDEFGNGILGNYDISDLEVPVSFDADGRFLGFGQGGAVTFNLTITPLEAESLVAGADDDDHVDVVLASADLDEEDEEDEDEEEEEADDEEADEEEDEDGELEVEDDEEAADAEV